MALAKNLFYAGYYESCSLQQLELYQLWRRKIIAFSHLATPSCLHSRNVRARVGFWRHRSEKVDLRGGMSRAALRVDLVAAMLKESPSLPPVSRKPWCTISRAPLSSVEWTRGEDDDKITRLSVFSWWTLWHVHHDNEVLRTRGRGTLTFGSVFAFVVNLWTRHTLLNMAPKASVNPVDRIQARAWQIWMRIKNARINWM